MKRLGIATILFLLGAASAPAQGLAPVRQIAVNYSQVKGPHNKFYREVVGAGRAAEGLRAANEILSDYKAGILP